MQTGTRRLLTGLALGLLMGLGATYHLSSATPRVLPAIVSAAEAFLGTLDDGQLSRVQWEFDHQERFNFNFVPTDRSGLPLREMSTDQRSAALDLLRSALSSQGYHKATGVMQLEEILGALTDRPDFRDPENYHFWIFGTPSLNEPWGWRFEGHHVSLNFTSADGLTVTTPAFIGANPARVPSGPHAGWRLLAHEEDFARALAHSLTPDQRQHGIIAEETPGDIITGRDREARLERKEGVAKADMDAEQRALLRRLLDEYVGNADPEIAAERMARVEETGVERLHFAWAGSLEPGEPHYYRIHGPTLLIEYDNTQGDANHIHSVWRDLENDFGEDILRRHYETADHDHGHDHRPHSDDHGHEPHSHGEGGNEGGDGADGEGEGGEGSDDGDGEGGEEGV